jgi:hypothetical protein
MVVRLEVENAQDAAIALIEELEDHDRAGLAALGEEQRREQYEARRTLYDYIDRIWGAAKVAGIAPATREDWSAVAGLRDLSLFLSNNAFAATAPHEQEEAS